MKGTLKESEAHPSAHRAKEYLINLGSVALSRYLEAFSSCAIEGTGQQRYALKRSLA